MADIRSLPMTPYTPKRCGKCMTLARPGMAYCTRHARKPYTWCHCLAFPARHVPLGKFGCIWPQPETRTTVVGHGERWLRYLEFIDPFTPYAELSEDERARLDARLDADRVR